MWKKDKRMVEMVDSQIITEDFIIADGTSLNYGVGHKGYHPSLKRDIFVPVMYLLHVTKKHPLKVTSSGRSSIHVFPPKDKRMPMKVYEDKKAYNISTLLLLPYSFDVSSTEGKGKGHLEKVFDLKGTFKDSRGRVKGSSSLLFFDRGMITMQDSLKVSHVMPSQVPYHIDDWLSSGQEIYSHRKTFDQKLEGRICLSRDDARGQFFKLIGVLEKRYDVPFRSKRGLPV